VRRILSVSAIAVLVIAALLLTLGWNGVLTRRENPTTVDAYVAGDRTPLSAQVTGYVRTVFVADNETVRAGQPILEIVDDDYRAGVAQAQAQLDAARAAVDALGAKRTVLEQQLVQSQETIVSANAQLAHAFNDVRRQQLLLPTAAGLLQSLQTAQAAERRLEATRDQAVAQAGADERQLDLLSAQTSQAKAQVAEAAAGLELAQIALGYTRLAAPIGGTLGARQVRPGTLLAPGTEVDTLTPLDRLWVSANFTERQITNIRVGQRAEVRIDALPGTPLKGEVVGIQPATGAQFSEVPADNTTGNFTKVVQRVPVKIALDIAGTPLVGRVLPGLSARAQVFTDATQDAR
jgi:membrane fusion protein (multidrug efflux system)